MRLLLVLALFAPGCASYQDDVELMCSAEDHLRDVDKLDYQAAGHAKKATILMSAIERKVKTAEGKKLYASIGAAAPAAKFELLRTEAAKAGLTVCPFADFLEKGGSALPPIDSKPPAPPMSASVSAKPKELSSLKILDTKVTGKLAPEPLARIVRANFPKLRACYEEGLNRDDSMKGTLVVKLTITAAGAVQNVAVAEGTLLDPTVRKCIVAAYQSLTFPLPETGKAQLTSSIEYRRAD